ncbi:MAG: 50S ribosomal protein L29 [Bacteroidota bacterium]|jgi:large subunit ribosomal protein L29
MKAEEMRDLSETELRARIEDETENLQKLKFDRAIAGQLENPALIQHTRREIARLKTVLNEKLSAE